MNAPAVYKTLPKGDDAVKKKMKIALFLAVCLFSAACAAAAEPVQQETHYAWQEVTYQTSMISSSHLEGNAESTLYFNDGVGRLIEFHMTRQKQRMTLVIRQNMNVVWKGSTEVDTPTFSVGREERMGQILFHVTLGSKEYEATIDEKGNWQMDEIRKVLPASETLA